MSMINFALPNASKQAKGSLDNKKNNAGKKDDEKLDKRNETSRNLYAKQRGTVPGKGRVRKKVDKAASPPPTEPPPRKKAKTSAGPSTTYSEARAGPSTRPVSPMLPSVPFPEMGKGTMLYAMPGSTTYSLPLQPSPPFAQGWYPALAPPAHTASAWLPPPPPYTA
ncbi:hypothetical protein GALMADRAFT_138900 [Galerina marginata CBS 339.88]|uniref:Uncharacterized protein n=1 Tax=Galerina marginata (strain CBS 339.88) TaxID=685588 RepID=A0A067TD86_GALM3|nr:hypothetical protein GALMADRAFT_138900 [Galerina marginata CBS 339.88]